MSSFRSPTLCTLLFVEDDKTTREIVCSMIALKFPQCVLYNAENGKKGLELFEEHTPDLVITDINMPEMDGIEMAREIKAVHPNATFIVLSARKDSLNQFEEIGYCAYLMKPVDFNALFNAIKDCHLGLMDDKNKGLG